MSLRFYVREIYIEDEDESDEIYDEEFDELSDD